jgi:hypothetical protein
MKVQPKHFKKNNNEFTSEGVEFDFQPVNFSFSFPSAFPSAFPSTVDDLDENPHPDIDFLSLPNERIFFEG